MAGRKRLEPKNLAKKQRRKPKRAGSRETVEAILEAAARILDAEGLAALNTNLIASKAGVSIGTLYGYFANREEILNSLAQAEMDRVTEEVVAALAEPEPIVSGIRRAVRALIRAYSVKPAARRRLMEMMVAAGRTGEFSDPIDAIVGHIVSAEPALLPPEILMNPMKIHVATRAVYGVIRTAAYEEQPFFLSEQFETEIVTLVEKYLNVEETRTGYRRAISPRPTRRASSFRAR